MSKHGSDGKKHDCPKKCVYCKDWYEQTMVWTRKIQDEKLRDKLIVVWETLWLNNCLDFDVISTTLGVIEE